ncbi:MAG: hypothetical protein IJZ51_10180 [Ruminiclostridium sp.]|nr:hypothetical protein [Ruminiclostridium sp.]
MRKIYVAILIFSMMLLCSCSNINDIYSEFSGAETVTNPFHGPSEPASDTEKSDIETLPPFSDEVSDVEVSDDFDKYQEGGLHYSNYNIKGGSIIRYDGDDIEISFDADSTDNPFDVEIGYIAFIEGFPQKLSLNGGQKKELVSMKHIPDTKTRITLTISPRLPHNIDSKTLRLKIMSIFNPSYTPQGEYTGFGNAHSGQSFCEYDIEINAMSDSLELSEGNDFKQTAITEKIREEYKIGSNAEEKPTGVYVKDAKTKEQQITLNNGKAEAELILYGKDEYTYNIYLYKNHRRISFNNCDYLCCNVKKGFLTSVPLQLNDVIAGDVIYAIAVPSDAETGSMKCRKSVSLLVR